MIKEFNATNWLFIFTTFRSRHHYNTPDYSYIYQATVRMEQAKEGLDQCSVSWQGCCDVITILQSYYQTGWFIVHIELDLNTTSRDDFFVCGWLFSFPFQESFPWQPWQIWGLGLISAFLTYISKGLFFGICIFQLGERMSPNNLIMI